MNNKLLADRNTLGTSLWVVILSCSAASAAHANQGGKEARLQSGLNALEWRAFRREMRQQQRQYVGNVHRRSVPAPGEPLNPPPTLDGLFKPNTVRNNAVQHNALRGNRLPGQVSLFRTTRPDSSRRSTYINDAGRTRSIHNGVSLDLSSTDATITVGSNLLGDSAVTIDVGGSSREIKAGTLVTAAEYAALNQKLSTGSQDLKLNGAGAAIDGSLNLNVVTDDGRAINTSAFVVPESVEVGGDFARHADGIRVQNDLINYGSIYATSSNRKGTAVISARDVNNFESGLITTDVSKAVASTLGIGRSTTNLAVRADRDLNNQGEITSSGQLELSAGNALNNDGFALARGTVSVKAPTINNLGLISSEKGDLNITSPIDANLAVNARGGEFRALNGDINVATTVGANPKTDTKLLGGAWHADNLNIVSGDGWIVGDVDDTTAMVNIKGGSTSFNSNGENLLLGTVVCSGDPLISSAGNLTIGSNQITGGQPLAIIAAQSVNVGGGVTILDTSSATGGGTITIVSGADFTTVPGVSLTIKSGNIAGGDINLSGLKTITSSGSSGNANGGNITIVAFGAFGIGTVTIPTALQANGIGTGNGGNITVIGANNLGTSISMLGAESISNGLGGNILIASADADASPDVVIDATATPTQGAIISGSFVTGLNSTGKIVIQNSFITSGGSVNIFGNGSIETQAISTAANLANLSGGNISVLAMADVNINSSLSTTGNGTGSGGTVDVTSSNGNVTVSGAISTVGGKTGNGGLINIFANQGDIFTNDLKSSGGSISGSAADISVLSSKADGTITFGGTQIFASSVVGAGGNVQLVAGSGSVQFNQSVLITAEGSTNNGDVLLVGSGGSVGGIRSFSANKSIAIDNIGTGLGGDVTLTTSLAFGLTLNGGSLTITSGRDVSLFLGPNGINTGGATAGFVFIEAGRDLNGGAISTVPSSGANPGGDVTLTSKTGDITIGAIDSSPSGFNLFPGVINLNSADTLNLNGNLKSLSASQLTGVINLTSNQATNLNLPQINTATFTVNSSGDITTTADSIVLNAAFTSKSGAVILGNDPGDDFAANTAITIDAGTSISQVGSLTSQFFDISYKSAAGVTLNVSAPSLGGAFLKGNIALGKLTFNINNAGDLDVDTNMADLVVNATGKLNLVGATGVKSLDLETGSGQTLNVDGVIVATTDGVIRLSVTDGDITQNAGGGLETSGTGFVQLTLNGAVSSATLEGSNNNINSFNSTGTAIGGITIDNGANAFTLTGLGSNHGLKVSTTNAATGVVIGSAITTSSNLEFNTPRFFNDKNVSAASILTQNLNGNLDVVGGGAPGGKLSGSVPAAGTPGNPSVPTAINFVTKAGANLNLFGDMEFNGDVTLDNEFGTTTSNAGSLFHGNNNVVLKTSTWNTTGSQITGNKFIFQGSGNGNIVNSKGAVSLGSDITIKGHDVAIVALTDINITGVMTIDLSNDLGPGGTLTMLAGYEVTPATANQEQNAGKYSFTSTASSGNIAANKLSINTSGTSAGFNAGDVTVIANGGTVDLGSITADSNLGVAGGITIVGEKGVTVGNISAKGGNLKSVQIATATPVIFGTPQLDNGTISGGSFGFDGSTLTAANITVNDINAPNLGIYSNGSASNTIDLNGDLTNLTLEIDAGLGELKLNKTNNIVAGPFPSGGPGSILVAAGKITALDAKTPVMFKAASTKSGGTVLFSLRGTDDVTFGTAAGNFQLSATGNSSGGNIAVTTEGAITVDAGGINAFGAGGRGASYSLISNADTLTLNDLSILDVDATAGSFFDGGSLTLSATDIIAQSTAAKPLVLSANGDGIGAGGSITVATTGTTPIFIGSPTKPVKGAATFLELSALGGATGGAGGSINIDTGGTLFVDTSKVDASPQGGTSSGATYAFNAGSSLVVSGPLNADGINGGNGGIIDLESNSKTTFVVDNGGKAPKNGTSSTLSANGFGGRIEIRNFGGGLNVKSNLTADELILQSSVKGGIVASKGVVLTGTNQLRLFSSTGAIGKKPLDVSSGFMQAISIGAIKLNNVFAGPSILFDSSAAKGGFTFTAAGDLTVQGIVNVNGDDLSITTSGANLNISNGTDLLADNGSITINNANLATGSINIGEQVNIATSNKKGDDVIIAIGPVPKKGVNTTPPANFDVNPVGKGQIFFDGVANGIVVLPGAFADPVANGIDKNVIFSNLTTGIGVINVETGTTITADPPIVERAHSAAIDRMARVSDVLTGGIGGATITSPSGIVNSGIGSSIAVGGIETITASGGIKLGTGTGGVGTGRANGIAAGLIEIAGRFVNLLDCNAVPVVEQSSASEVPVAQMPSDMLIDAAFHGDAETLRTEFAINANTGIELTDHSSSDKQSQKTKRFKLTNGNILFAPKSDTTIETPHGTVTLAANSLALVMQSGDRLAVFDIDDQSKNAVVVTTGDKRVSLSPGRSVVVSSHRSERFEEINPIELIQYRGLNQAIAKNGWKVYTSEFSIPSACFAVKPLMHLTGSNSKELARLRSHLLKTNAVLMHVRPDQGDFQQFFKPQVTAMN